MRSGGLGGKLVHRQHLSVAANNHFSLIKWKNEIDANKASNSLSEIHRFVALNSSILFYFFRSPDALCKKKKK